MQALRQAGPKVGIQAGRGPWQLIKPCYAASISGHAAMDPGPSWPIDHGEYEPASCMAQRPALQHLAMVPSNSKAFQVLLHMPQVHFALGTAQSTAKVRSSGRSWGMSTKHCDTLVHALQVVWQCSQMS